MSRLLRGQSRGAQATAAPSGGTVTSRALPSACRQMSATPGLMGCTAGKLTYGVLAERLQARLRGAELGEKGFPSRVSDKAEWAAYIQIGSLPAGNGFTSSACFCISTQLNMKGLFCFVLFFGGSFFSLLLLLKFKNKAKQHRCRKEKACPPNPLIPLHARKHCRILRCLIFHRVLTQGLWGSLGRGSYTAWSDIHIALHLSCLLNTAGTALQRLIFVAVFRSCIIVQSRTMPYFL